MEESVATRLKLFIDTRGLSVSEFADMCGIPRPTLSQILTGRNKKVSDILVGQIHRTFPDLSVLWLLFGEGPVNVNLLATKHSPNESVGALHRTPSLNSYEEYQDVNASGVNNMGNENQILSGNQNFDSNTTKIRGDIGVVEENSNVRAFNSSINAPNDSVNQIFTADLKIKDLQGQIDYMKKNPRRVLQITIYYDDSTFETFVPK